MSARGWAPPTRLCSRMDGGQGERADGLTRGDNLITSSPRPLSARRPLAAADMRTGELCVCVRLRQNPYETLQLGGRPPGSYMTYPGSGPEPRRTDCGCLSGCHWRWSKSLWVAAETGGGLPRAAVSRAHPSHAAAPSLPTHAGHAASTCFLVQQGCHAPLFNASRALPTSRAPPTADRSLGSTAAKATRTVSHTWAGRDRACCPADSSCNSADHHHRGIYNTSASVTVACRRHTIKIIIIPGD